MAADPMPLTLFRSRKSGIGFTPSRCAEEVVAQGADGLRFALERKHVTGAAQQHQACTRDVAGEHLGVHRGTSLSALPVSTSLGARILASRSRVSVRAIPDNLP